MNKSKLVSLVAPSGRRTQFKGETLELLLVTHFPNLVVTEEATAPAAVPNIWTGGWLQGLSLIGEWNGQLILLSHTKVQEWMRYSQPCCKRDGGLLFLMWSRCHACLVTGYVPGIRRQVNVVFIPKPGRKSGSKDFRHTSLTLFLLKVMERLVARF